MVAVAHSILVIAYHVIATGQPYHDLGADYFTTRGWTLNAARVTWPPTR